MWATLRHDNLGSVTNRPGSRAMSTVEIRSSVRSSELGHAVSATDVVCTYGRGDAAVHALRGISVEIAHGELTALLGAPGSGKSTLMHVMAGLARATSGDVAIAGARIRDMKPARLRQLRHRHVGFIHELFNLLPGSTVEENILQPLELAGREPDPAWIRELVELTGVGASLATRSSLLSPAEQQRTAIARALACRPTLLYADEPTGSVDPRARDEVLDVLRQAVSHHGQTVLMATSDPYAAAIADRILIMADGLVVEERTPIVDIQPVLRCATRD
jgi:putative ABC transport system ATP-binding protein